MVSLISQLECVDGVTAIDLFADKAELLDPKRKTADVKTRIGFSTQDQLAAFLSRLTESGAKFETKNLASTGFNTEDALGGRRFGPHSVEIDVRQPDVERAFPELKDKAKKKIRESLPVPHRSRSL